MMQVHRASGGSDDDFEATKSGADRAGTATMPLEPSIAHPQKTQLVPAVISLPSWVSTASATPFLSI
jgi:hypothetical protein